ncbi:MAG: DinB family protein [Candidatus Odinarchaeota archaeon]
MDYNINRQRLKEMIRIERAYGYRMLGGLTSDELTWQPEGTRARTIQSYLRHIINAEIHWLRKHGDTTYDFFANDTPFDKLMDNYHRLGEHLIQILDEASDDEMLPRAPISSEEKKQQGGTLAWIVWRTSLHALHHYAQIAHIRYSIEKPPSDERVVNPFLNRKVTWGEAVDVIFLSDGSKK